MNFAIVFALLGFPVGLLGFPLVNSINYILTKGASLAELLIGGVFLSGGSWIVYTETSRYYRDDKHLSPGREG
ncbi:MAG: hypothetical protein M3441_04155 [Chloroflexota bacterium]|nr:hypothetical protein [Chloroflexota bacterium]